MEELEVLTNGEWVRASGDFKETIKRIRAEFRGKNGRTRNNRKY